MARLTESLNHVAGFLQMGATNTALGSHSVLAELERPNTSLNLFLAGGSAPQTPNTRFLPHSWSIFLPFPKVGLSSRSNSKAWSPSCHRAGLSARHEPWLIVAPWGNTQPRLRVAPGNEHTNERPNEWLTRASHHRLFFIALEMVNASFT